MSKRTELKKEVQRNLGPVLAWAELEMAKVRYPRDDEKTIFKMLESKYDVYSRTAGEKWGLYIDGGDKDVPWPLFKKLYLRHRYTTRPTSGTEPAAKRHPRLKAKPRDVLHVSERLKLERKLEKTQEIIWQQLREAEGRCESPRLVLLELISPNYHSRLMTLEETLRSLVAEALRDRTDIKQTVLLDLLEPVIDELGG